PLAGLTATQIFGRAITDLGKADSVHIRGVVRYDRKWFRLDLRLLRGEGCVGKIAESGQGTFGLIVIAKTLWVRPNGKFWHSVGVSPAALRFLSGKYLTTSV